MNWSLKSGKKITPILFIAIILYLGVSIPAAHAQNTSLTQAFILLAPEPNDTLTIAQLQTLIKNGGGRVTHIFPNQAFVAKVSDDTIQQISTLPIIVGVFTEPVELSLMDVYGPNARRLASIWNNLIMPPAAEADSNLMATEHPEDHNDALIPPDLPGDNGTLIATDSSITPGYYQTSEYMAGSVAVGVVLVESDGSVDPSTENWTTEEKQQVFNEIVAGLNWWAEMEPRANLSFVYDDHFTNPLPTSVEPVTRPYYHQQYWISDALGALGYSASSYFTRVRDYNNALRNTYQTDWAFTIFVVDSSADSDNRFSDGYFAYAYLGGPFTVMTYGNNGYGSSNIDAVLAHEVGHIFRALDQYYSAYQSCTLRSGYLYVENQNSQYGDCTSNVTSIMRSQTYPYWAKAIDPYAAGQIGWRDSDSDNILDPLDTELPITIDTFSQEGDLVTVSGTTNITPYPSPIYTSVTINTLTGVQYRFDDNDWQPANATDGTFDGTSEIYNFTTSTAALAPGVYTLKVAALDSAGNVSDEYATQSITVLDPIDGGLNTELYQPTGSLAASQTSSIGGVAYHLAGSAVTNVEYRVDGGSWQPATAEDGTFDSDYEPFTIVINSPDAGTVLVEARATAADGSIEVNFAGAEISVSQTHTIFLPVVLNGM